MMAAAAACMLTGCKTKVVTVPETHTSYIHRADTTHVYHRDSIYRRDSIFTTVYVAGDTVYNVEHFYHYDTQWRDRVTYQLHTDTLLRVDSVSVAVPVVTEKKVVHGWAWTVMLVETLASGVAVAIWWYRRKK